MTIDGFVVVCNGAAVSSEHEATSTVRSEALTIVKMDANRCVFMLRITLSRARSTLPISTTDLLEQARGSQESVSCAKFCLFWNQRRLQWKIWLKDCGFRNG